MAYPSVISTLANPAPTDRLNSPSHSGLHDDENAGIIEIQTFLGTLSSVQGTVLYDVRSPDSDGGGHIQTAAKGGTGQTQYTKGDLLVGQSSSVLTKVAIGQDGQILQVNSSMATGVTWVDNSQPKIAISGTTSTLSTVTTETSIFSVPITGSTLGTSNAIRARLFIERFNTDDVAQSFTIRGLYGTSSFATLTVASVATNELPKGALDIYIVARGASSQLGTMQTFIPPVGPASAVGSYAYRSTSTNIDSSATQNLGVTVQLNTNASGQQFVSEGYIVEKIN